MSIDLLSKTVDTSESPGRVTNDLRELITVDLTATDIEQIINDWYTLTSLRDVTFTLLSKDSSYAPAWSKFKKKSKISIR